MPALGFGQEAREALTRRAERLLEMGLAIDNGDEGDRIQVLSPSGAAEAVAEGGGLVYFLLPRYVYPS